MSMSTKIPTAVEQNEREDVLERRASFLSQIFSLQDKGYIRLARLDRNLQKRDPNFWVQILSLYDPDEVNDQVEYWLKEPRSDIYFCPHLFSQPNPKKEYALPGRVLWADLDDCYPRFLGEYHEPLPQIVISTSMLHAQAYWLLKESVGRIEYEVMNHRIALAYKHRGCDQSGWDLTQMLRIPYTYNYKRERPYYIHQIINTNIPSEPIALSEMEKLPSLGEQKAAPVEVSGDMSFVRSLKSLNIGEWALWSAPVEEGERSEHVFRLVHLLKINLGFGDGLVIKTLLEHPVLIEKWEDPKNRATDIIRCLVKIKSRS